MMNNPKVGQTWQHRNGNVYTVTAIANNTEPEGAYQKTVVYEGKNGNTWSRPLRDWHRSMTLVPPAIATAPVTADMVRAAREAYYNSDFPEMNKFKAALKAAMAIQPTEDGSAKHWKEKALYWAAEAHKAHQEALRSDKPVQWPAQADEGMLQAMLGWKESDAREGLPRPAAVMDQIYHALWSHMRDTNRTPAPKAPAGVTLWMGDKTITMHLDNIADLNFPHAALASLAAQASILLEHKS